VPALSHLTTTATRRPPISCYASKSSKTQPFHRIGDVKLVLGSGDPHQSRCRLWGHFENPPTPPAHHQVTTSENALTIFFKKRIFLLRVHQTTLLFYLWPATLKHDHQLWLRGWNKTPVMTSLTLLLDAKATSQKKVTWLWREQVRKKIFEVFHCVFVSIALHQQSFYLRLIVASRRTKSLHICSPC